MSGPGQMDDMKASVLGMYVGFFVGAVVILLIVFVVF